MEELVTLVSFITAIAGLFITALTFIIKFVIAIKKKDAEEAARLLREGAESAVKYVESVKAFSTGSLDGPTKKTLALTRINQFCIDNKIAFDETAASKMIEEIIALTKTVNARVKDTRSKQTDSETG